MHSYKQQRMGWSPDHALKHSSKVFWHDFFQTHLPEGTTRRAQYGVMKDGVLKGEIPEDSFVIKPTKGGAGQYLRTWEWDAEARIYRCDDKERSGGRAGAVHPGGAARVDPRRPTRTR